MHSASSGTMNSPSVNTRILDPAPPSPMPPQRNRFAEPLKFLPIVFVVCVIVSLYLIYMVFHCLPMLQLSGIPLNKIDDQLRQRGQTELLIFHLVTALLMFCYVKSVLTHPGQIPDDDMQWEYLPNDNHTIGEAVPMNLQEVKKSGDRRHCKWCGKYKPDRCHHCRVCKTCILRMDHHCPWIYNCVGFANYKFFFLLLLYAVIDLHFIVWTMAESVQDVINDVNAPFSRIFFVLFGETLAFFLGTLTTCFFAFHIWLMLKAMTTIEFCEKSLPKKGKGPVEPEARSYDSSVYDFGFFGNVRTVLGDNPLLWLVPVSSPVGDGLNFMSDETRLTTDIEGGRGMRRKTHQRTQRTQRRTHGSMRNGAYDDGVGF